MSIVNISITFYFMFLYDLVFWRNKSIWQILMFINHFTLPHVLKKVLSLQFVQIYYPNFWFNKSCELVAHAVYPNSCTKFNSATEWIITSCWTEWNIFLLIFSPMSGYYTLTFQMMPSRPVDTVKVWISVSRTTLHHLV